LEGVRGIELAFRDNRQFVAAHCYSTREAALSAQQSRLTEGAEIGGGACS
jgi:hypothetical protein